jgi:tetratricopeptide (TPR) repeat protein
MFPITSLILIGLALLVILTVIIRKFPVLAILDVGHIPGEKEAKFKEQLIKARVERDLASVSGWFGRLWLWLVKRLGLTLQNWQAQLKKIKISHKVNIRIPWREKQGRIKELFSAVQAALKKEKAEEAEDKLVEIISLDQKNLAAFVQLGGLYANQKKWPEARETYEYALKLARQDSSVGEVPSEITPQQICFALSGVDKEAGDLAAALENIREALEREPNSPRYLDLILDLSIMRKDKNLATASWEKLSAVNPDNQKLAEWKEKIEKL